ncbi:hypothetical protein [Streptomyces sp. S.PNR 29]|uniref:hypothetical protein n=1 Tax=Streptomyces sp. S.PNR 29 TaxID=2973805 RepID=UPI0025B1A84F|nr:hypothetical protein [Streptomyces sp. S.PNR 29]MDN0194266.1 hypothetical protein [Streptomyces sp. S.PNR 29]
MSENPSEWAEPAVPAPEPAEPPARRGRAAAVATSALLGLAVLGGAGYTAVAVQNADRDAGAPRWEFPKDPVRDKKDDKDAAGKRSTGLAGMLVPYGTGGWGRGPDLGAYGSDAELSGDQATALRKEALSDLPRSQRKRLEKEIDRQRVTGMAMRSYLSTDNLSYTYTKKAFTMSIVLARMESRAAARNNVSFQNEFLDALGVFRKGPAIDGHQNAHCFLPPKDADEDLESMFCSAYVGDVLVTATADAARPLDTKGAALLLREQLDRIADPGEAV